MVDEGRGVAHLRDLAEEVGAHEDRPALPLQGLHDVPDLRHPARVQARRGLVEDQKVGLVEEGLPDREPLLHPL